MPVRIYTVRKYRIENVNRGFKSGVHAEQRGDRVTGKAFNNSGIKLTVRILVDADGCPVVNITIDLAGKHGLECILFCDTSHYFERDGSRTITVSQGADSADFKIVNTMQAGDIVVTQDYGLAAMCLARKGKAINQNGMVYHDGNMDALLSSRHMSQKIRRGGGRTKGPSKRKISQDKEFARSLEALIKASV